MLLLSISAMARAPSAPMESPLRLYFRLYPREDKKGERATGGYERDGKENALEAFQRRITLESLGEGARTIDFNAVAVETVCTFEFA